MNIDPTIIDTVPLPDHLCGFTDGHRIWLNPRLSRVGRRCTLEHERVHVERGIAPPWLEDREERIVNAIASKRLLPIDHLIEVLVWTHNTGSRAVLAWYLDVDLSTLDTRLRTVTEEERAAIEAALDDLVEVP